MHPEAVLELTAQLSPVARSLGSNPEASGGSTQISPLPDPDQPGRQHHISRSCKRQEGLLGGQRGEVSVLQGIQQAPAGAFRCLLRDLNSPGNSTLTPGSAGGKLCTRGHLGGGSLHW